jgi:hypoxanthine phosphoribosyltransferase
LGDRRFIPFINRGEIDKAIEAVAAEINKEYVNDCPILLITLNGAIVFAVDLMKHLTGNCRVSCIKLSSYSGITTTNEVKNLIGLCDDIENKRVLIIEDIIDTGNTYEYMVNLLEPL